MFEPKIDVIRPEVSDMDIRQVIGSFEPGQLPSPFRETPLIRDYGRLWRVRSTDLWEAILPHLVRQHGDIAQTIQRYRALCTAIGDRVTTSLGTLLITPRARTVASADDKAWGELANRPWVRRVRAAARMYLERQTAWAQFPPDALFHAVRDIHGIGTQSAAGIIADITNDFSRYESIEFGTPGRWHQFCDDLDWQVSMEDFAAAWKVLSRDQRSTLAALSIDWRQKTRRPAQARLFESSTPALESDDCTPASGDQRASA
ncbi:hypothetical protein [Actinophytocola sp. KF-1]